MFNNLIESSSHKREFKRRGSFLLFTTATYAVLFVIAGVASIYAYDARLEDQNLQYITMLSPVELDSLRPTPSTPRNESSRGNSRQNYAERAFAMSNVNDPRVAPASVSAAPNTNLPLPDRGLVRFTGRDYDPGSGAPGLPGTTSQVGSGQTPVIEIGAPPPAAVVPKPAPKILRKGIITSQAISLPKPNYPPIARNAGVQGSVNVQVLIDEEGKVISAKAVSGHPLLVPAAQQAALAARFSPTILGEVPVKVSGVITYNFLLH